MRPPEVYVDLDGRTICLGHLDAEERELLERMRRRAAYSNGHKGEKLCKAEKLIRQAGTGASGAFRSR